MKPKKTDTSLSEKRNLREIERRRSNREAILHAAEAVICRKGLNETSMDNVAAEAGFSKATVYKYIPSKTELVFELMIHFMESLENRIRESIAKPLKHEARLQALLREVILHQTEKENIARAFLVDKSMFRLIHAMIKRQERGVPDGSDKESEFFRRMLTVRGELMDLVGSFLEDGVKAGAFRPMSAVAGAGFISAVIQGYQHDKFFRQGKPDLEKDVSTIYTFILRGFSADK